MVQWLRLCASNARGTDLIPVQGAKIPYVVLHGQENEKNEKKEKKGKKFIVSPAFSRVLLGVSRFQVTIVSC